MEYFNNGFRINDNNKVILHYISLAGYAKVKIGPLYGVGGFAPSFKIAEKETLLGAEHDPLDKSNWFDVPFFLGVGLQILVVSVEAPYHWGVNEVNNGAYSQYLQLGGTISF